MKILELIIKNNLKDKKIWDSFQTNPAGYQEFIKKLKTEHLQERQEMLPSATNSGENRK